MNKKTSTTLISAALVIAVAAFGYTSAQAGQLPGASLVGRFIASQPVLRQLLNASAGITFTGEVKILDTATGEYVPFTGSEIPDGACILTGVGAQTSLTFTETSSAQVAENTVVCLNSVGTNPLTINLSVPIGHLDVTINEPTADSVITITTPLSVAREEGNITFSKDVEFPGTDGMTPAQVQQFILDQPIFSQLTNGQVSPELLVQYPCVRVAAEVTDGSLNMTALTGAGLQTFEVTKDTQLGDACPVVTDPAVYVALQQVFEQVAAGQEPDPALVEQINNPQPTATPVSGGQVLPTATPAATDEPKPTPQPCGDNVCDIYAGENALTCPKDCAP